MHFKDLAGKYLRLRVDVERTRNDMNVTPRALERLRADLKQARLALIDQMAEMGPFVDTPSARSAELRSATFDCRGSRSTSSGTRDEGRSLLTKSERILIS
jgi:hypothetical protein